jgi:general secretion pathway protein L
MKPQLVLQLPGAALDANTMVSWAVFDSGRQVLSGRSALASVRHEASAHFDGGEVIALVPGELVLLIHVRIPTRQLRHIKQALPYMVEEMIADNIEDVHLAMPAGKLDWDEGVPVAVVRHHLLIDWLDQLHHCQLQPDFLGPDVLAVPWREQGRHYFVAPPTADAQPVRVLCRHSAYVGQVIAPHNLPVLVAAQARDDARGLVALRRYVVSGGSDSGAAVASVAEQLRQQVEADVEVAPFAETSFDVLATTAVREREAMINLLQGGYRVQRRGSGGAWQQRAAMIAGVGLLGYLLLAGGGGLYFSWRAQQLEQQSIALYRELFPGERRVVSPRKQMANHLRERGQIASDSLLPLLARAANGFAADPAMRVDELRFNQQQNALSVQLRAPSLDALEQLKKSLQSSGLDAELGGATVQGEATVGRLQIREQKS